MIDCLRRRSVLQRMRSSMAVSGSVVALLAVTAPAWAGSKLLTVTVTYATNTGAITTTVDRKAKEIASISCTLNDSPVDCGNQVASAKNSTTFETFASQCGGTFVATVTSTKGATASDSVTVPGNLSACAPVSAGSVFPIGASM